MNGQKKKKSAVFTDTISLENSVFGYKRPIILSQYFIKINMVRAHRSTLSTAIITIYLSAHFVFKHMYYKIFHGNRKSNLTLLYNKWQN